MDVFILHVTSPDFRVISQEEATLLYCSGRSFTLTRNNNGPITEPYVTSLEASTLSDCDDSSFTLSKVVVNAVNFECSRGVSSFAPTKR